MNNKIFLNMCSYFDVMHVFSECLSSVFTRVFGKVQWLPETCWSYCHWFRNQFRHRSLPLCIVDCTGSLSSPCKLPIAQCMATPCWNVEEINGIWLVQFRLWRSRILYCRTSMLRFWANVLNYAYVTSWWFGCLHIYTKYEHKYGQWVL